jgi:hypothetical protein
VRFVRFVYEAGGYVTAVFACVSQCPLLTVSGGNHFSTRATSKSTPINHLHKQQKQTCKACMCTGKSARFTCGGHLAAVSSLEVKSRALPSASWDEVVSPSPLLCRRQATHARTVALVSSSCVSHPSFHPTSVRPTAGQKGRARRENRAKTGVHCHSPRRGACDVHGVSLIMPPAVPTRS